MRADTSITVLLVDDQPLFTSGLRLVIEAEPDMICLGETSDGAGAIAAIRQLEPDVVLLDLRMPRVTGLDVLQQLGVHAKTRVIVLTTVRDREALLAALRLGASAYLTKDARPKKLLATIRLVHQGESALANEELLQLLASSEQQSLRAPVLPELSPREREVYLNCARGLTNAEIATALVVAEATVKSQLRSVMHKLGLRSRVQVAIHAYEHRIVRPVL